MNIVAPCQTKLLKNARLQLGLTQADLSELTEIPRRRISALECGTRLPKPEESDSLCIALGVSRIEIARAVPEGPRPNFALERRRFESPSTFLVPRDRPSELRFYAARKRYPSQIAELSRKLRDRPDLDWIGVYLREASFDSGLELLASLHLLADGAEPGWVPPQRTGFTALPIVNPVDRHVSGHHPYPALLWKERFLFPQVSVLTRNSLLRLDFLLGVRGKPGLRWWDVEFDGFGHDQLSDALRDEQVSLPVKRFSTEQIVSGDFLGGLETATEI